MNNAVLHINASIGKEASQKAEGLEAKIKASMRAVREGNWMETDENKLFLAAIAGVLDDVGTQSNDGKALIAGLETTKRISAAITAAQAGVSVDMASCLPEDGQKILPLVGWWKESE